ncbi:MAG: Holliday junction resolvase RuvX [Gemmatimonadota bacterium]|nr:Holliday junction resolvase RuvX [Gemmatimonadota bacterium]MDH5803903.1 Holliday junction resolvase RuvX [Gemmatimonadota bacterium]
MTVGGLPQVGPLIAIDWGEKRIGLALCRDDQTLAHPLAVMKRRSGQRFPLNQLRPYLDEVKPVGILLGLPLTPSGEENQTTESIRKIGRRLTEKTNLPVDFFDERMTTARVLNTAKEMKVRPDRSDLTDALAATVLLQTYLDSRR